MVESPGISKDGTALTDEQYGMLKECRVDRELNRTGSCVLRFSGSDGAGDIKALFKPGDKIKVDAPRSEHGFEVIFEGLVTAVSIDLVDDAQPDVIVECLDDSYMLASLPFYRSMSKVKLSDVVQKLVGEAGMKENLSATTEVFDNLVFAGSARDALDEIVERLGAWWFFDDKKIHIKDKFDSAATTIDREDLQRLTMRWTGLEGVKEVVVNGWDPVKGELISGSATSARNRAVATENTNKTLSNLLNTNKTAYPAPPALAVSQADAKDMAQADLERRSQEIVRGWGETAEVNPEVAVGKKVRVTDINSNWDGEYPVCRVEHVFAAGHPFFTRFDVGPAPDTSLHGHRADKPSDQAFGNLTVGVVTAVNKDDGDGAGADVKVSFPHLEAGGVLESGWARVVGPGAGKGKGFLVVPEFGDRVLVGFEHGDPNRPFVLGGLWSRQQQPQFKSSEVNDGAVQISSFKTRGGHSLTFRDAEVAKHQSGIVMELSSGTQLDMNIDEIILDTNDKPLTIKGPNKSEISIDAQGNIVIKGATVKIEAQQTVDVKSGTDLTLDAGAGLKASAKAPVEVKSSAKATIDGGGLTEVKGGVVKVN